MDWKDKTAHLARTKVIRANNSGEGRSMPQYSVCEMDDISRLVL